MAENWANSLNGAHIVDVSSEIEGCLAENALNNQLNSIWLTEEGLPQWICISLAKVKINNNNSNNHNNNHKQDDDDDNENNNVVIKTVGWYCWHQYKTNPKIVTIHVSADGSKFKPWDTFTASMSSKEAQLFCCAPISTNIYPYVAIEVTETFGGNQTYMNEIFLYSEEMVAAPTLNNNDNNNNNSNITINTPPPTTTMTDMNASIHTHHTHHTVGTIDTQVLIGRLEDALGIDHNTKGMDASITSELSIQSPHPGLGLTEGGTTRRHEEDDLMSSSRKHSTNSGLLIIDDDDVDIDTIHPIPSTGDSTTSTTTITNTINVNVSKHKDENENEDEDVLNASMESGKVFFGARSQTGNASKINPSTTTTTTTTNSNPINTTTSNKTDNDVGRMSLQDFNIQPTKTTSTSTTTKGRSNSGNNDVMMRVQRLESVVNKLAGAVQRLDMGIIDDDDDNDTDGSNRISHDNINEYHHSDYIAGHLVDTDNYQQRQQPQAQSPHEDRDINSRSSRSNSNRQSININYTTNTNIDDNDDGKQWPLDRDPPDLDIDVNKFKEGIDLELDQAVQRVRAIVKKTRKVKQVVQSSIYTSSSRGKRNSKSRSSNTDSDLNFDLDFDDDDDDIYNNSYNTNTNNTSKYGYGVNGFDDDGYRGAYDRSRSKQAWSPKVKHIIKPKVDSWWCKSSNSSIFEKYKTKTGRSKINNNSNNRSSNGDIGKRKSISTNPNTTKTTSTGRNKGVTFKNNTINNDKSSNKNRSRSINTVPPLLRRYAVNTEDGVYLYAGDYRPPPRVEIKVMQPPPIKKKSTTVQVQTQPEIDVNQVREVVDRMVFAAFNSNNSNNNSSSNANTNSNANTLESNDSNEIVGKVMDMDMKTMIRTLHDKVTRQMQLEAALKRVKLKKQYGM